MKSILSELKEHTDVTLIKQENQQLKDEIMCLRNNTETLNHTLAEMVKVINEIAIVLNNASSRLFNIAQHYSVKN